MKKILISNDDGVNAPGIAALEEIISSVADVTVVAPQEERSTTGHTLTVDNVVRIEQIDEKKYGCSGYPADCSLMGLAHILKEEKPDLILSGINRGGNLGQDIYYSGTVAAAREATFNRIPAIAVSLDVDFRVETKQFHYDVAGNFVKKLVQLDIVKHLDPYTLLNVNVPNVSEDEIEGVEVTYIGFRYYAENIMRRIDSRGRPYFWIGGEYQGHDETLKGSDCCAVSRNMISVTPMDLLNRYDSLLPKWQKIFQAI